MAEKYDRKAIEAIAKQAGFGDYQAWLWSIIALAESEGDPSAVNRNSDGSTDTGLWQINSIHRKANPAWTEAWLKNPLNNARAAFALAKGDTTRKGALAGTQPWYSSEESRGDYKGWKERAHDYQQSKEGFTGPIIDGGIFEGAKNAVGGVIEGAEKAGDAIEGAAGAIGDVGAAAWKAGGWIANPRNWLRVGYVIGGLALVVSGATILAKPAIESATSVLPVGKIASLAKGAKKA